MEKMESNRHQLKNHIFTIVLYTNTILLFKIIQIVLQNTYIVIYYINI